MRSNYSPFPQQPETMLNQRLAEIELAKRQVQQANENLIKVLEVQVPLLLRHHTLQRPTVKLKLDQMKREIQASNSARVTATDQAWAFTMAEIESMRAVHHEQEQATRQQNAVKKTERATLTHDPVAGKYFIMREVNLPQADGTVKLTKNKVYLPDDHEYLQ